MISTSIWRKIVGAAAIVSIAGSAYAGGNVAVFGQELSGFSKSTINNFYNTYGGNTSVLLSGSLDSNDLSAYNLLWLTQPANAYTAGEITSMANYIAGGGRIAFMGEHGSFGPNQNLRINAALSSLGATITINNLLVDAGFRSASVADGQIKTHPLTEGVNTYEYAAFAPLTVSGSAQVLMTGEENTSAIMMAYQNIGAGSVFLITDQNVWDNAATLWGSFDNEIMFQNLVTGVTGAPPVPEPASWVMMIGGFGLVGSAMRRRKTTVRFA